jgi:RimJ/RimL family protein N-acetyltransferase
VAVSAAPTPIDPAFDGDPAWRVTRSLKDGTPVVVRPLGPDDREGLRQALLALSPETRYLRFLDANRQPTEELLTYLTGVDQKDHVALCATIESPDLKSERGIGVARFIRLDDPPDTAEGAIVVVDDMHHRGVARVLLGELVRAAEVRAIRAVRAEVLAENEPMRRILERAGATRVEQDCGAGIVAYDLVLHAPPKHHSLFEVLRGAAETMALRFTRSI